MIETFRRVLVLSPHPDDAELGAAGTIARLSLAGADVRIVRFSKCAASLGEADSKRLVDEGGESALVLGASWEMFDFPVRQFATCRQEILDQLIRERGEFAPDLVMVHATGDIHQDHEVVRAECLRAFRGITVVGYELPWSNQLFVPTLHVKLSEACVDRKCAAIACYATQKHRPYLNEDVTRGLLRVRGLQCGATYAEAFEVLRAVA